MSAARASWPGLKRSRLRCGVLLLGEAGIGKTALARRLAGRPSGPGAAVIGVAGRAVSSGVPFEAFAGVITGQDPPGAARKRQATAAGVAARVPRPPPAPG